MFYIFLTYAFCGVSLVTTTVISLDRVAALHYHRRYVAIVTKPRVIVHPLVSNNMGYEFPSIWSLPLEKFSICYTFINCGYALSINILIVLHPNFLNCSASSNANSRSATGSAICLAWRKLQYDASEEKLNDHFVFLVFLISCYFPMFILTVLFGKSNKEWPSMEPCCHCSIHEFFHQPIVLLLAHGRTSSGSCKSSKDNLM